MRVLAYYGPKDVRDEEWPRPKKVAEGFVRVAPRAVALGERSILAYLENNIVSPCPIGETAAGIIEESTVEGLLPGMPAVLWNDDPAKKGLSAESLIWDAEHVFVPPQALSYQEMALLPFWAEVWNALEGLKEKEPVAVLGQGPLFEIVKTLLPFKGGVLAEEDQEANLTICCESDDKILEKAQLITKTAGAVKVLSYLPGAKLALSPLALQKRICFNFGTVCQKKSLEKIFALTKKDGLSLVCGSKLFSWDQADKAVEELEKGSFVTLYQESFDEPYFP